MASSFSPIEVLYKDGTVAVNKKFTFRIRSTTVEHDDA